MSVDVAEAAARKRSSSSGAKIVHGAGGRARRSARGSFTPSVGATSIRPSSRARTKTTRSRFNAFCTVCIASGVPTSRDPFVAPLTSILASHARTSFVATHATGMAPIGSRSTCIRSRPRSLSTSRMPSRSRRSSTSAAYAASVAPSSTRRCASTRTAARVAASKSFALGRSASILRSMPTAKSVHLARMPSTSPPRLGRQVRERNRFATDARTRLFTRSASAPIGRGELLRDVRGHRHARLRAAHAAPDALAVDRLARAAAPAPRRAAQAVPARADPDHATKMRPRASSRNSAP